MKAWLKGGIIGVVVGIIMKFSGLYSIYTRGLFELPLKCTVIDSVRMCLFNYLNIILPILIIGIIGGIVGLIIGKIINNPETSALSKGSKIGLLGGFLIALVSFLYWFGFEKDEAWRWKFTSLAPAEIVIPIGIFIGGLILGAIIGLIIGKIKKHKSLVK